jgi:hypothetical protein
MDPLYSKRPVIDFGADRDCGREVEEPGGSKSVGDIRDYRNKSANRDSETSTYE